MKTIEIRIPEMGGAIGTTKWVADKLERINRTLQVSRTKGGEPCLSYEHWQDKDKEGKPRRYILCLISYNMGEYMDHYELKFYNVFCVNPTHNGTPYGIYLFEMLSESAKEIVEQYLDNVCEKFKEEYNAN